ncbi:MAG: hypothetical protein J6T60_08025 [Bacteroidales bacterium]|nr:hypothetical protein [Bacteroidales bacterium]
MAKNDYSRRSKKDVFWGDDNNNKNSSKSDELEELFRQSEALEQQKEQTHTSHEPAYEPSYEQSYEPSYEPEIKEEVEIDNPNFDYDSIVVNETETETPPPYEPQNIASPQNEPSNITPPPYIPPQKQSTTPPSTKKKEDALEGFDVEKFIKNNSSNFSTTIIVKVFSQIICVYLLLKWVFNTPYLWWLVFIVLWIIVYVLQLIFQRRYTNYINLAIKQIKKVKILSRTPEKTIPWGTLLQFPYTNVDVLKEDEIVIVTDETKVFSCEVAFTRKVNKNDTETLLNCEVYKADMKGRTSFADNITLMKGKIPFIKGGKKFHEVSQYVLYYNDDQYLNECNIPRLCAIADRISAYLGDKPFAMHFNSDTITLALPIETMENFNYGFFEYTLEDRIRRDVTAIADRVCLSDMLAEN